MTGDARGQGTEADAPAPPGEAPVAHRGGGLKQLARAAGALVAAWLVLSVGVLFWQPGRFTQLGIALVVVSVALALPKKLLHRIGWLGVAIVMLAAVLYLPSYALSTQVEFTIRNTSRDAVRDVYLVHTDYGAKAIDDPGETFRNTDSPLFWKVNSSDWEGVIDGLRGRRVRARVIGIRFADRSVYRNIIWVRALERGSAPPPAGPGRTPT